MPAAQPSAALVFCSGVFVSFSVLPSCGLLCCPGFFVSWCFVSFLCFFSVPLFLVFLPPSVFFGSLVFSLSPFPRSQGVVFPVFELAPFCSWFLFPVTKKKPGPPKWLPQPGKAASSRSSTKEREIRWILTTSEGFPCSQSARRFTARSCSTGSAPSSNLASRSPSVGSERAEGVQTSSLAFVGLPSWPAPIVRLYG